MEEKPPSTTTRIGIAGLGQVGRAVAAAIDSSLTGYTLTAVSARHPAQHQSFIDSLNSTPKFVEIHDLAEHCDVVVEGVPASVFAKLAQPMMQQGKELIVLTSSALLDNWHFVETASEVGAVLHVPTGALLGLDAVLAASEGVISELTMRTSKPPQGLAGAPYLTENNIDVLAVSEPTRIFEGSAREAGRAFPSNVNVAVSLSLAGLGPDSTKVEVWADPEIVHNTHTISLISDSANLSMTIQNIPTENARTGRITAQSVIALLRKRHSALRIGT